VLQAVLAQLAAVDGHFVTSLHANYVVNLDFEQAAPSSQAEDDDRPSNDVKVMAFAGGKQKFRCTLPSRANGTPPNRATGDLKKEDDVAKSREHFLKAKLVTWSGTCWKLEKDKWVYELCFNRKIVGYRSADDTRISLGQHSPDRDELLPGGGVRQMYVGGTDNRTSEVTFVCGMAKAGALSMDEDFQSPSAGHFLWTVTGPQFCKWRENDGAQARDHNGDPLQVSTMLEGLRGQCFNVTQGWWTYEYCYPTGLTQFHVHGNNRKREPEYSLGSSKPGEVNMTMVTLKPSISPRERRAPPSRHRTLKQRLVNGTVCDETKRPRATSMMFQCPPNWQANPATHIASINEGALCEYEVMIHTTLLCGHEKFLPTLPKGKETIQCVAEPQKDAEGSGS